MGRSRRGNPPRAVSIFFTDDGYQNGRIPALHHIAVQVIDGPRVELLATNLAEGYRRISRKQPGAVFGWTAPRI